MSSKCNTANEMEEDPEERNNRKQHRRAVARLKHTMRVMANVRARNYAADAHRAQVVHQQQSKWLFMLYSFYSFIM